MKLSTATLTIILVAAPATLLSQTKTDGRQQRPIYEFCVIPPDSNWRPVDLGFDTENHLSTHNGDVKDVGYPVIRNVEPGSVADSAGIRDGDVWRAVDHHDFLRESGLARVRGPGVPIVLTIARGDSVFERRVVPRPAKPSRCSK